MFPFADGCWTPFSVKGPKVAPKGPRTRWRQKIPKKRITITSQPQINEGMEIDRLYTDGKVK